MALSETIIALAAWVQIIIIILIVVEFIKLMTSVGGSEGKEDGSLGTYSIDSLVKKKRKKEKAKT